MSKVEISEGTSEKKCVLVNCSNVLNKIIVQAMEGYSLISFAALQCFNLLQNWIKLILYCFIFEVFFFDIF